MESLPEVSRAPRVQSDDDSQPARTVENSSSGPDGVFTGIRSSRQGAKFAALQGDSPPSEASLTMRASNQHPDLVPALSINPANRFSADHISDPMPPMVPDGHSVPSPPSDAGLISTKPLSDLFSDLSIVEQDWLPADLRIVANNTAQTRPTTIEYDTFSEENFVTQWKNATSEDREIQVTYHHCIQRYGDIFAKWSGVFEQEIAVKQSLHRTHALLGDWGEAYDVMDGQLDQLPNEAKDLTETILAFLVEIITILEESKRSQTLFAYAGLTEVGLPKLLDRAISVTMNTHTAKDIIGPVLLPAATFQQPALSDHDDVEEGDDAETFAYVDEDDLKQCAEELHDYVQLLNELHPSIESWVNIHELGPEPTAEDLFQHSASSYYSAKVRAKYIEAPEVLVEALGELNYERYKRLADSRDQNLSTHDEVHEREAKSASFKDSGIGSSMPLSELATIPSRAPSRASSLAFTLAGQTRTKLPQLPKDARHKQYPCAFCGATVSFQKQKDYE